MRLTRSVNLAALLPVYESLPLSYVEVGQTSGPVPAGYHHAERRGQIGSGRGDFERAVAGLMSWDMHRRAGLKVAADGPATVGGTVLAGLGLGLCLVVPCRVVSVVDEPTRRGFAYGTLPGHPERGEELFLVTDEGDQGVWFTLSAFSGPGNPLVRLAGPLGRAGQALMGIRYEKAIRSLAAGAV